ncbi:uncharacterized protein LOC124927611 [Impatiens glandulifera]|uniref:uncharacterized protein LOC124927611 n=1 Tax=Impatiens glandulifera TaxID=253017 RepID=UPI001FB199A5|nr:uncharacterized protein LOC124927611 [Impatiens glandulifera]
MASDHHDSRINTLELKDQIYQKIGNQRADMYFDHLQRFFSCKINKAEFNKLVVNTIGRENIYLHNLVIQSILKNASLSKIPPSNVTKLDGSQNLRDTKGTMPINRNNRKFRDRPSPLGPLAKTPTSTTTISRPVLEEDNGDGDGEGGVDEGEEVEQATVTRPITAPLGISMKPLPRRTPQFKICEYRRELPDTKSLMIGLEKLVAAKGLGLSADSANLLNKGLNAYLKRLIEPCIGLARSRCDSSSSSSRNDGQSVEQPVCGSMVDFHTTVENNPQSLGHDWSSKMEKVCFRAMPEIEESRGMKRRES